MKVITKISLVSTVIPIIILFIIIINDSIRFCNDEDILTEKTCIRDNKEEYESITLLETSSVKVVFLLIFISSIFGTVIYFFKFKEKKAPSEDIKETKVIDSNKAENLIKQYFAKRSDIPYVEDKNGNVITKNKFITFYRKNYPFLKADKEWRCLKQFEISEGDYAGIYTAIVNLSRGAEWILNGDFFYERNTIDKFSIDENKYPMYQAKTKQERLFERLEKAGQTELLQQLQQEELQKEVKQIPQRVEDETREGEQQQQPLQPPLPRLQPRRPYHWRRRY